MARPGRRFWLVDASGPEFQQFMAAETKPSDVLLLPMKAARYAWPLDGFEHVFEAKLLALRRAFGSRRLSDQGPRRRAFELDMASKIADNMATRLGPDVTELVVDIKYLLQLWQGGHLGGRRFTVLLTRWPMKLIHEALDETAVVHPERKLLSDFRAQQHEVDAEWAALSAADRIVTPHVALAAHFPDRAHVLSWVTPQSRSVKRGTSIAFPGPTAARKGAYGVREAARRLDLEMILTGSELEGPRFWDGIKASRPEQGRDWLDGVAYVVQPAIVEERPTKLLEAMACGVPIIATPACGIASGKGVTIVPPNDAEALIETLVHSLSPLTKGEE